MHRIKYLAIIPARGGSKRLPRKNVLNFNSKPLIAWTIDAALKCSNITEVVISTDDKEIAEVGMKYGAKVPFIRPAEISGDSATSVSVVLHVVDFYEKELNTNVENIILLQPTSPLRNAENIQNAIDLFESKKANSVVSVCKMEHSPIWCNVLPDDLSLENFIDEKYKNIRSQDLPIYFRLNGAIYIANTDVFKREKVFISSKKSFAYVMPNENSIDIDTELDFEIAEVMSKKIKG